jgi:hypothetical protein
LVIVLRWQRSPKSDKIPLPDPSSFRSRLFFLIMRRERRISIMNFSEIVSKKTREMIGIQRLTASAGTTRWTLGVNLGLFDGE